MIQRFFMKVCPVCNQTYTDENLNFCLNDGGTLTELKDDAPPTIFMDRGRTTQPNWGEYETASSWQSQPLQPHQSASPNQPFYPTAAYQANQTLPIVSLSLGIASVTIGWCCSLGVLLAPGALITGFIALSQIKKDPQAYTGKGFAIGGIVTAAIYLVVFILLMIIYGIAIFFGNVR